MSDDKRQEAEQRYIAGEETLAEIAAGMGLPLSSVKRWCKAGDWVKKREAFRKRAMKQALSQAAKKKAKELAKLLESSDEMEAALLTVARSVKQKAESGGIGYKDSKYLLNIAWGIEKMATVRQITGGAMSKYDTERIRLLKKKQKLEEKKAALEENREAGGVKFTLEKELDEITE